MKEEEPADENPDSGEVDQRGSATLPGRDQKRAWRPAFLDSPRWRVAMAVSLFIVVSLIIVFHPGRLPPIPHGGVLVVHGVWEWGDVMQTQHTTCGALQEIAPSDVECGAKSLWERWRGPKDEGGPGLKVHVEDDHHVTLEAAGRLKDSDLFKMLPLLSLRIGNDMVAAEVAPIIRALGRVAAEDDVDLAEISSMETIGLHWGLVQEIVVELDTDRRARETEAALVQTVHRRRRLLNACDEESACNLARYLYGKILTCTNPDRAGLLLQVADASPSKLGFAAQLAWASCVVAGSPEAERAASFYLDLWRETEPQCRFLAALPSARKLIAGRGEIELGPYQQHLHDLLERAIEEGFDEGDCGPVPLANALMNQGYDQLLSEQWSDAERSLDRAVKLTPENLNILLNWAEAGVVLLCNDSTNWFKRRRIKSAFNARVHEDLEHLEDDSKGQILALAYMKWIATDGQDDPSWLLKLHGNSKNPPISGGRASSLRGIKCSTPVPYRRLYDLLSKPKPEVDRAELEALLHSPKPGSAAMRTFAPP